MQNSKKTNRFILLALIILAQVAAIVVVGFQKEEYHIDEIYSYFIANSAEHDAVGTDPRMWGQWFSGRDSDDYLTVREGNEFDYRVAYRNTSTDCHPPMFYWALHTVCSLFPNQFNKWLGLSLNILCFVIAQVFLYLLSEKLIKNRLCAFLPVFLYGFSTIAVDTATFIRMYMLLTMFAMIFTYASIQLTQRENFSIAWAAVAWGVLYLGAMTQYYFLVYAFWLVLILCLRDLCRKNWKRMFAYGGVSAIAVALMLLSFPYAIEQATGSSTNNVGNEVAANLWNFRLWAV